jgi:hypothetical protein
MMIPDRHWTPIADRMPAAGEPVWLATAGGDHVVQGYADTERWHTDGLTCRHRDAPWTHWMPREPEPEPPPVAVKRAAPDGVVYAHCVYEARVRVTRDADDPFTIDGAPGGRLPSGFAAVLDAEGDLVALVPDVPGLVNPNRPLPELVAGILNWVAANRPGPEAP